MSPRPSNRLIASQKIRLNTSLSTSIQVLRFDAAGLIQYLDEQAAENPYLSITPAGVAATADWTPRWTSAFSSGQAHSGGGQDMTAQIEAPAPGLMAHVEQEIRRLIPYGRARLIAGVLMQSLEPSGWLTRPLAILAREAGASLTEAEAVLARLHQMEPTGLFARSLAECLQLQAAEANILDAAMAAILAHLDVLARGDVGKLAQLAGVDEAAIRLRLRQIRSFDPKPGSQFGQGAAPVREPDLIARKSAQGWQISLNRSALPDVTLRPLPPPQGQVARDQYKQAKALGHMLASRNQTLLRVATDIFTRQHLMLDHGLDRLRPMTMAEVAATLDLHESTISRAIAGVSIDTPSGVLWLRALFSTAPGKGDGSSATALRAKLANLIAKEDPHNPLSDLALSKLLSEGENLISRRTVAKYRTALQIRSSHERRVNRGA